MKNVTRELLVGLFILLSGCSQSSPTEPGNDPTASSDALQSDNAAVLPIASATSVAPVQDAQSGNETSSPQSGGNTASNSGCYTVTIGGGFSPGTSGMPGTYSPGQQSTICSAPTPATPIQPIQAIPAARAIEAARPVLATPVRASAAPTEGAE